MWRGKGFQLYGLGGEKGLQWLVEIETVLMLDGAHPGHAMPSGQNGCWMESVSPRVILPQLKKYIVNQTVQRFSSPNWKGTDGHNKKRQRGRKSQQKASNSRNPQQTEVMIIDKAIISHMYPPSKQGKNRVGREFQNSGPCFHSLKQKGAHSICGQVTEFC